MAWRRRAKITVEFPSFGWECSKYFIGTEDDVYAEAHDWMHEVALRCIQDNAIEDPDQEDLVIDDATHTIEWEDENPKVMYAVYENYNTEDPVYGVYSTRADAEEAIFTECESYVYELMMTADPMDVMGLPEWTWDIDYKWLMEDAMKTFAIQEVPVYDIMGVRE